MKLNAVLLLVVASAALPHPGAWAQGQPTSAPATATAIGYPAVGIVKQVDVTAGKVTISHDAIAGLDWPAMTMSFGVKDKSLFDKLTVDRKVEFTVAKQGAAYVITSVK
jgi:Cu(I)/Ag(I) efflux system periplasmic protein CusF